MVEVSDLQRLGMKLGHESRNRLNHLADLAARFRDQWIDCRVQSNRRCRWLGKRWFSSPLVRWVGWLMLVGFLVGTFFLRLGNLNETKKRRDFLGRALH